MILTSKILKKYKNISHGFFNKKGGVSKNIYSSLNCGYGSKDSKNNIKKNLNIVVKKIGCEKKNLVILNQLHSNKIFEVKKPLLKKLRGDGIFTQKRKVALCILTADCAPIFLFDKKLNTIGAVHAGWKGAYKNIINKLIKEFFVKGSKKKNLIGIIGPCIKINSYEVKSPFVKKFTSKNKKNYRFFKYKNNKIFFDLTRFIKFQMFKNGIKTVEVIKKDTFDVKNNFFSSRYSKKKNLMIMVEIYL